MTDLHPNIALLEQLDVTDVASCSKIIAEEFVWHYFNPKLPELQGDYIGLAGFGEFFEKMRTLSKGTFEVHPQSATAYGDELVVVHARNRLTTAADGSITIDAVVVWRMVDGKIVEAWDIPSVYTL
ncbi:MAG: nuclear transport factor 2 family protein [Pseudomonadota bacterium]